MIIDAHSHGFHRDYVEKLADAGGDWARKKIDGLLARLQEQKPHAYDVKLRVEQLDRYGIDLQVVTSIFSMDSNFTPGDSTVALRYARTLNECMAKFMEDSKGRLIGGGTVPLDSLEQGGLQEMERAIKTLGLKAINLPSHVGGKPLDSPEYEAFWAKAAETGVAVYIHPADPLGHRDRPYEGGYDLTHNFGWPFETELALSRLVFSGLMERYPEIKVVSHHLGGGIPFFWGRIVETYDPENQEQLIGRVLDKPLFEYFSRFYYDTAVGGSAAAVRCAHEVFGAERLVFATDAPFGPGGGESRLANYPDVIRSLGLPEEDNEKIFSGNARQIFNLS